MAVHHLKVTPEFFEPLADGTKKYEIRLGEKPINKGDVVLLHEYDPEQNKLTGRTLEKKVTFVINTKRLLFWSEADIEKWGLSIYSLDDISPNDEAARMWPE